MTKYEENNLNGTSLKKIKLTEHKTILQSK